MEQIIINLIYPFLDHEDLLILVKCSKEIRHFLFCIYDFCVYLDLNIEHTSCYLLKTEAGRNYIRYKINEKNVLFSKKQYDYESYVSIFNEQETKYLIMKLLLKKETNKCRKLFENKIVNEMIHYKNGSRFKQKILKYNKRNLTFNLDSPLEQFELFLVLYLKPVHQDKIIDYVIKYQPELFSDISLFDNGYYNVAKKLSEKNIKFYSSFNYIKSACLDVKICDYNTFLHIINQHKVNCKYIQYDDNLRHHRKVFRRFLKFLMMYYDFLVIYMLDEAYLCYYFDGFNNRNFSPSNEIFHMLTEGFFYENDELETMISKHLSSTFFCHF